MLSTDPPYYDNISYADLSDFFYVWQRRMLRDIYPELYSTLLVPKSPELIVAPHRHDSRAEAKQFFEEGMYETFRSLRQQVDPQHPATIYYAYKQQDHGPGADRPSSGWETMLNSLIEAGFQIVGTWPLRTELAGGFRIQQNSLASSIILVCRPRPADAPRATSSEFRNELRAKLPPAIDQLKTSHIAATDLAQAAIGPGMSIYSRYASVRTAAGAPVTVREALGLINRALDEYHEERSGYLDPETQLAIAWFEQNAFRAGPFGAADVLARARNTSVDRLADAGLVESGGGTVRLLLWSEYDPGELDPESGRLERCSSVWKATHFLIERHTHGEGAAADLLRRLRALPGWNEDGVRDLCDHLYNICDKQRRPEIALDYKALTDSWPEILRLANSADDEQTDLPF